MILHSLLGDPEFKSDTLIGQSFSDHLGDLFLSNAEYLRHDVFTIASQSGRQSGAFPSVLLPLAVESPLEQPRMAAHEGQIAY
jgi:hypothetical protein